MKRSTGSRRGIILAGLLVVSTLTVSIAGGRLMLPVSDGSAPAVERDSSPLAQSYSGRCQTNTRLCTVRPRPIGSACECPDGSTGVIVR